MADPIRRHRILIAEDEKGLRDLLSAIFQGGQWEVFFAVDGVQALDMARKIHPDLVILDIVMPGMFGWDVVQALRRDPATQHVKVLMLSALIQDSHKRKAFQSGADAYMEKPFSPRQLLATVEELLSKRR
ncbi:DNA-binding response regulator MtrA [bacterium HR23]|nr:DNA-binding response regulator MtrA [bacterium HR23]